MARGLIERLGKALAEVGVPYMIIGGQAVLLYGELRATKDVDVTVGIGPDQLRAVLEVCRRVGLSLRVEDPAEFVRRTLVLPTADSETGLRVDFVFSFTPYERQAIERARKVRLGATDVAFASPEDVVIHKVFAGRPRDLDDVRGILLRQRELDQSYVLHWLRELGQAVGQDFASLFEQLWEETREKK